MLAQVETDKATMDMEASKDGFFAKVLVKEGTADIPLGQVSGKLKPYSPHENCLYQEVCIIVENKEDIAAFENYEPKAVAPKVNIIVYN